MTKVCIIGGGVIGLCCGWRLQQQGHQVTILERGQVGQGASWAAAGMLAPQMEAEPGEESLTRLLIQARQYWPSFVKELEQRSSQCIGYRQEGTMHIALNGDESALLERQYAYQQTQDLGTEWISGYQARKRAPHLSASVRAAIISPDDHQVDNRALTKALASAFLSAGGTIREGCTVSGISSTQLEGARTVVTGAVVEQDQEPYHADITIIATGAWTSLLPGVPSALKVVTRPIKGAMISVQMEQSLIEQVLWGARVYIVPRNDNRLLIGASIEDVGFDTRLLAGSVRVLLNDAVALLPDIDECPLLETWTGLRPGSQDDAPILGAVPGHENLLLAVGHHRNGILLAPYTGALIADMVAGKNTQTAFGLARFKNFIPKVTA